MSDLLVDKVAKHYATPAGVVRAVDGVTIEVPDGSSVAIVGRSGCGKSTLLGLIGGLESPTSGQVLFGKTEISALTEGNRDRFRRTQVGLLFQSDNLIPFLTVLENVAVQLAMIDGGADYERCYEVLEELGLAGKADDLPDHLSGGQRQRVALARALINRPGLILADEPTGELDASSAGLVVDRLLTAQHESGATMVVVTHDPTVAERMDRIVALEDGRLTDA